MEIVKVRRAVAALAGVLALIGGTCAATATAPSSSAATARVTTHDKVWEREAIPFRTITQRTDQLDRGVRKVSQPGKAGVRVRIWKMTLEDGVELDREVVRNFVARKPVTRIILVGTHVKAPPVQSNCDSNYTGACVPISSDVDCGGGSGNGPGYVYGTVHVVGSDIYDLDADGDGYGCD
jgi:hypothetical protein